MVSRLDRNRPLPEAIQPRVDESKIQKALDALFIPLREVGRFLQPFVQPEKWQPGEFLSGWADLDGRAGSKKDPLGRVHLRGYVGRTSGATVEIMRLPLAHRPTTAIDFAVYTSAGAVGHLEISAGGIVTYVTGTATDMSLEGVSFDTED